MLRVVLIALAISSTILFAILVIASIYPLTTVYAIYQASLTSPMQPNAIAVMSDRVCQLYMYDINYASIGLRISPSLPDLYQYKVHLSWFLVEYGRGTGFINLTPQGISIQVFEVDKGAALEVQRMIREELRYSNYSQYLPIVTSKGLENIVSYVEKVAVQKALCTQSPMFMAGPGTVHVVQFKCNSTNPPSNGNAHIVEVCIHRDIKLLVPQGSPLSDTRLDRLINLVANSSLYNISTQLLREIVSTVSVNMFLWSYAQVESSIVLQPRGEHVLRALAFCTAFVSGIALHYRFRPHEYAGLVRFFRKLRQKIYRQ